MPRNTDPKVPLLIHGVPWRILQTCPRHFPGLERQASARKRLHSKLEVGLQIRDQGNNRVRLQTQWSRQQAKKASQIKHRTWSIVSKANIELGPRNPRGMSKVTAPADLYSLSLQVEGLSPIHKNSSSLWHPPCHIPTAIQFGRPLISIYPSGWSSRQTRYSEKNKSGSLRHITVKTLKSHLSAEVMARMHFQAVNWETSTSLLIPYSSNSDIQLLEFFIWSKEIAS